MDTVGAVLGPGLAVVLMLVFTDIRHVLWFAVAPGIVAMAHCVEAFTNRNAQPVIDGYARMGIDLVGRYLARAGADSGTFEVIVAAGGAAEDSAPAWPARCDCPFTRRQRLGRCRAAPVQRGVRNRLWR